MNLKAITTRIKNHLSNYHQKKRKKTMASEKKMQKIQQMSRKESMKKIPEIGANASLLMLIGNVLHSGIKSCSDQAGNKILLYTDYKRQPEM